jgi:small-conductance mechanosensitive channel
MSIQKIILSIFFLFNYLYAATIDQAFFKGEDLLRYYEQVEKEINSTINQKLKDPKIIELERSTLQKLKKLQTLKTEIKTFPAITLSKRRISQQEYLNALYTLSKLSSEIEHLQNKSEEFQEKLFELKNQIEKEVTTAKPQSTLLSKQMQYAFYKISKEKLGKSLSLYSALFDSEFNKFQKALPRVRFTATSQAKKVIRTTEQKIDTLEKKDLLLTIDKDSKILQPDKTDNKIKQDAQKIKQETDETLTRRIRTHILLALKFLQQNKETNYLETMQALDQDIQNLSKEKQKKFHTVTNIIMKLADNRSNITSVAIASTQVGLQNIIENIQNYINKTLFVYEEKAFSIRTIFTFSFILFIGLFIAKIYKNFVDSFRKTNRIKSLSTARMMANSGYYLIILGTFFIALKTIGLDMHTIFLVIGAILLWLAFGLQSFISNYAIGILLKIDRSIRIGDHIELDPQTAGDVDDMDFRSVTIRSSDNTRTTIPNSRFISGTFINHTLEGFSRRLHVHFSASKYIPHEEIETKILTALEESDLPHLRTIEKKAKIIIVDINRKIVRYALLVWVPKELTYDMSVAQSTFLKLIHKTLYPAPINKT